jgi:hypothetical protein
MANKKNRHDANPATVEQRIINFLTGVGSKLVGAKPLEVEGVDLTSDQLTAKLQSSQAPYIDADETHRASTKAIQVRDEAQPGTIAFLDALEHAVRSRYGDTSPDLEAFGIAPKKPKRTLTPEQKFARAQKIRATRAKHKEQQAQASPPSSPPSPPQKT